MSSAAQRWCARRASLGQTRVLDTGHLPRQCRRRCPPARAERAIPENAMKRQQTLELSVEKGLDALLFRLVEGAWTSPSRTSATGGSIAIVETLLSRGLAVNHRDENGWTPFPFAAGLGRSRRLPVPGPDAPAPRRGRAAARLSQTGCHPRQSPPPSACRHSQLAPAPATGRRCTRRGSCSGASSRRSVTPRRHPWGPCDGHGRQPGLEGAPGSLGPKRRSPDRALTEPGPALTRPSRGSSHKPGGPIRSSSRLPFPPSDPLDQRSEDTMARSGSTARRLQSAAVSLLTVIGLTAPARSGRAASPPAAEGGDTVVLRSATASGLWNATA